MDIKLKTLEKGDNQQIANLINNKKIWDNLKDHIPHPYHLKDANDFISLTKKQFPATSFGIIINENELCGVISLIPQTDIYRMNAEIGYWIGENYWGQGIATKAIALITKYGFEELKFKRIYAGVFESNKSSMKILKKNGYKCEGILRNAITKNHVIMNEHIYAKLRKE